MDVPAIWVAILLGIAAIVVVFVIGFWSRKMLSRSLLGATSLLVVGALVIGFSILWAKPQDTARESGSPVSVATTPSSTVQPITATKINELAPVDELGKINPGYAVTETVDGNCDSGPSEPLHSSNAHRCAFDDPTGSYVADPCWGMTGGKSVYCVDSPWDLSGPQLNLDKPVVFGGEFDQSALTDDHSLPWAIEVVDPTDAGLHWRCMARQGAGDTIGGNILDWNCTKPDGTGEAKGLNTLITDTGPVFKVLFSVQSSAELVQADVAAIWN